MCQMKKNIIIITIGYFLSLVAFPSQSQPIKTIQPEHYATIDGHKMYYQIAGSGSPAIIFEAGGGNDHTTWRKVFPAVSKFATAFCYDRPGFGLSDPVSTPRTYKQIATELQILLRQAHVNPPYVLVGHSFGGGIIRAFASLFPSEVAGLVFIDPISENMLKGWPEAEKNKIFASIDSHVHKYASIGEKAEWPYMSNDAKVGFPELQLFKMLNVPSALLIAGKGQFSNWVNNLLDWYRTTFEKSTEASLQVIPYSTHYIHLDEPEVVVSAIKRIIYPDAENIIMQVLKTKGIDSALTHYRKMKLQYPSEWLSEDILNNIGYIEIKDGHIGAAISLFKLNVEMYPDVYTTYSSLAEGYMHAGNNEVAIKNFEKSLQLNPANTNAVKMLKKLKEKK